MAHSIHGPTSQSEQDRQRELAASGPLIEMFIQIPNSPFSGVKAWGLIDTGASVVCIDRRAAAKLGLKKVNEDIIGVVGGGAVTAEVYIGELAVPSLGFSEIMPLYAVPMKQASHSVILGRSFLKNFIVTYDGPRGVFHFFTPQPDSGYGDDDFAT